MGQFAVISIAILSIFIVLYLLFKQYKHCPANQIMVIYGNITGKEQAYKFIHGGGTFIVPVVQNYQFLDLSPISITVDLKNTLSNDNFRTNLLSKVVVGISTDPALLNKAAERLLGLNQKEINNLASDIIYGQLRNVIAHMDFEEMNSNRENFQHHISVELEVHLEKIGLKLININIIDITES